METATPDVNTSVESSPAESTAVVEVPRSAEDYATWRNTGKLPEPKQPKSEAPAAPKDKSASGEEPGEKTAPAPEAGKPSQGIKTSARERLEELLADIKAAGFSGPTELKTFKREATKSEQATTPERTVNPPEPKTEELRSKPKLEDFPSWDEWQADLDKWSDEKTERRIADALHQERQARAQDDLRKQGEEKLAKAMDRYGEDAKPKIMDTVKAISEARLNPALDGMLQSSPVIADLLYAIGSDPEHLTKFLDEAKTDPAAAIRRLVLTEDLVKRELAKGSKGEPDTPETPERDKSGKFVSEKPPAKTVTDAPPPSREVSGRAAPPSDDAESAFAADDAGSIARIMRARNQRDVARHKGM